MGSGGNRSFVEEFRELIEEVKGKDPQKSKTAGKGGKTEEVNEKDHQAEEEEAEAEEERAEE